MKITKPIHSQQKEEKYCGHETPFDTYRTETDAYSFVFHMPFHFQKWIAKPNFTGIFLGVARHHMGRALLCLTHGYQLLLLAIPILFPNNFFEMKWKVIEGMKDCLPASAIFILHPLMREKNKKIPLYITYTD